MIGAAIELFEHGETLLDTIPREIGHLLFSFTAVVYQSYLEIDEVALRTSQALGNRLCKRLGVPGFAIPLGKKIVGVGSVKVKIVGFETTSLLQQIIGLAVIPSLRQPVCTPIRPTPTSSTQLWFYMVGFRGFGEPRPIESSGLTIWLVGSNPVFHPNSAWIFSTSLSLHWDSLTQRASAKIKR